jgi:ubiquinone/menaquinone biosynthesis C-methylase UbiE
MLSRLIVNLGLLSLVISLPLIPVSVGAAQRFRFAVMGCMHLGFSEASNYELAIEKIRGYNPDFVLFLGGMVDALGKRPPESLWEEFDHITEKLSRPVYNVFGDPSGCLKRPLALSAQDRGSMRNYFLKRFKGLYYSFEYKNNLFICLNSERELSQDEGQLAFLRENLADTSRYDNVFMVIHKSFWIHDVGDQGRWFDVVHPMIKEKVGYVFGAGLHAFNLRNLDGVNYITSAGAPGLLTFLESSFFHFLLVDVDKDRVSIKAVPILEDTDPIPIEDLESYETERYDWFRHELSPARDVIMRPREVIEVLNIKPGMTILDIGAGAGYFAFRFAEALKGTGKVFATDTDSKKIEHIKDRLKEGKYKNIIPVFVKSQGLDPFYRQHSFDIIFICDTYLHLRNLKDYFKELRPFLTKETGRLYILQTRIDINFSELDFKDFKEIIKTISSKGKGFAVLHRLDREIQYFIENWKDGEIPDRIQAGLLRDFNNILSDNSFYNDISEYYLDREGMESIVKLLYPHHRELAKWLILRLEDEDTFNKKEKYLTDIERTRLRLLNRIILLGIFKKGLSKEQVPDRRAGFTTYRLRVGKRGIISKMELAGFKFLREYDFLPQHHFLEFKRRY